MSSIAFKGVRHYGYAQLNEHIEDGFTEWAKWNFLNIGAFQNVTMASTGHHGGNFSNLRPVKRPGIADGKIWESTRGDWVWETGINYTNQPIRISGVYINNTFYTSGTTPGSTGFVINYPLGQIVFTNPLPTTTNVGLEFTSRNISITKSSMPWARNLLLNSYRVDLPDYELFGSGLFNDLAENRITLPAIVLEAIPNRVHHGYQLGGGQLLEQDLLFHVFTSNPFDRNQIVDILTNQFDSTVSLFNRNEVSASGHNPLSYDGSLLNATYNYPYLFQNHFYNKCVIKDVGVSRISSLGVFNAAVRYTLEVIREDI